MTIIIKCLILLLSFVNSQAWATVPVQRYPSGTPVQVCQPSDPNTNCGGASSGGTVTQVNTTTPITGGPITTTGTIACNVASGSQPGCISSTDWNTFNGKQTSGNYITALTGGVTASGPGSATATVVTNANLTGPITSVGNATSIASQTGTGTKFVVDTSPTLVTPTLGVATYTTLSGGNITANASNIITDTTTGMKIWTATNQKGAFFNSTPIVKPSGDACTALQNLGLISSCTVVATTNANLTGAVTSVGNATSLGSFTSANLSGALTDEVGTGLAVFNTSPKLITAINDTNNNVLLGITPVASAVNSVYLSNAATGGNPLLTATGSDTNISVGVTTKGTGAFIVTAPTNIQNSKSAGLLLNTSNNSSANGGNFEHNNSAGAKDFTIVADNGEIYTKGTAPTVSSCGTSPSVTALSNNNSGSVTVGSVSATSCTITFAYGGWTNAPNCTATDDTNFIAVRAVTTTTTLTLSSTVLTGDKVTWICQGNL